MRVPLTRVNALLQLAKGLNEGSSGAVRAYASECENILQDYVDLLKATKNVVDSADAIRSFTK